MDKSGDGTSGTSGDDADLLPVNLAQACIKLHDLILGGLDITDFLRNLATLTTAIVPGTHCAVTLMRGHHVAGVASSDDIAMRMDEIQYLRGVGPCLQAMRTSECVHIPDMATDNRWDDYGAFALSNGVQSSLSLPLSLRGDSTGALNLFSQRTQAFTDADVERARAFTSQAGTALTILLRYADSIALDAQLRDAVATRAVIDQALGILMVTGKISSRDAFEFLRHASQTTNRKLSYLAAELITETTGHPPEPPRPITHRD